jgi:hypothetical protein
MWKKANKKERKRNQLNFFLSSVVVDEMWEEKTAFQGEREQTTMSSLFSNGCEMMINDSMDRELEIYATRKYFFSFLR